jgi:hypothetical protein
MVGHMADALFFVFFCESTDLYLVFGFDRYEAAPKVEVRKMKTAKKEKWSNVPTCDQSTWASAYACLPVRMPHASHTPATTTLIHNPNQTTNRATNQPKHKQRGPR